MQLGHLQFFLVLPRILLLPKLSALDLSKGIGEVVSSNLIKESNYFLIALFTTYAIYSIDWPFDR
jgi:hypothetical protein